MQMEVSIFFYCNGTALSIMRAISRLEVPSDVTNFFVSAPEMVKMLGDGFSVDG